MSDEGIGRDQLRAFIERIERMEEEKADIAADIKEIYAEAKGNGYDTKILRKIVAIRKQDANERAEQEALLELYMSALGMLDASPDSEEDEGDDEMVDITPPQQTILRQGTTRAATRSGYDPIGFDTDGSA